jgi:hypothetical protein
MDIAETLPDLNYFQSLPLDIDPANFFEGLIMSIKNEILSKQSSIYKIKNRKKKLLRERICELKKNIHANFEEIHRQEQILDELIESDLRVELEKYKISERVNSEKITPQFMNLIRCVNSNKDSDLSVVCDANGNTFNTDAERNVYITNTFADIYSKPINADGSARNPLPGNCITQFLGDIAEHPSVRDSKLTEEEKYQLDSALTVEEFDKAVKQIKIKSAPGLDGISNKFIKKFWPFFRKPIFDYTNFCLERGELTESFKTAKIKLIPKKGDLKKIGNWRPISLLNCFYKIISRVITNRIRTVFDKITAVGQKGYSKKKCCQEVIFSLIDGMFYAKKERKAGCIVSVDIKKAFDSLGHDFMEQSLSFFNFGNNIISWIKTLCTGRKACIITGTGTGTGSLGPTFNLERGNAQGDVISPFIFNICYQILVLKIENDLQIKKIEIPINRLADAEYVGAVPGAGPRSKKVFVFVDDLNILTVLDHENLNLIKQTLDNFGLISGLVCNVQKSNVLPVGLVADLSDEIRETGFNFVPEITVLGFLLNNEQNIFEINENIMKKKIAGQIRFWNRLNLSLPGRINICKTMMYSQLNYIGSVIPVSLETISQIESAIHDYASGNLRTSVKRTFSPVKTGGLGLFGVKNFLDAQKASWIRRCKIADQDWKLTILNSGGGHVSCITEKKIDKSIFPVLHDIARAFRRFVTNFTMTDNNFLDNVILENEALPIKIRENIPLKATDLDPVILESPERHNFFKNLKIRSLTDGDTFINKPAFCRQIGYAISRELWEKLDRIRRLAKTRYGSDPYKKSSNVLDFYGRWQKGSKCIRKVLENQTEPVLMHNMVKFAENTDTVINVTLAEKLNGLWTKTFFSNETRTFIFKMHNNTLAVNTVVSHFVRHVSRNCTFCDILLNPEEEDETVLHLFFNCTPVETIRDTFFKRLTGDNRFVIHRREFFGEFRRNNNNFYNESINILTILLRKYFWDCKVRKNLPMINKAVSFIGDEIKIMGKVSTKFYELWTKSGLNLENLNPNANFL